MRKNLKSALAAVLVLACGGAVMAALSAYGNSQQEPPAERTEEVLRVTAATAVAGDYPVTFTAYGQARSAREAIIAPEVSGTVEYLHPNLADGGVVEAGETLFRVRQESYLAQRDEAAASVEQQEAALARISEEWAIEKARLVSVESVLALTATELARAKELKTGGVGSQSGVEIAERAVIEAQSQRDTAARGLDVFPLRLREAEAMLKTARARLELAELDLARSDVKAPFHGRIKNERLEAGQFISAGSPALQLADDTALEIEVSIDSRTARDWLEFEEVMTGTGWFGEPVKAECTIHWTEDSSGVSWIGMLDRVAAFDPESRMLKLVVRYEAAQGDAPAGFPLADGMFCTVEIPGKTMRNVFRVPAAAVTYDDTVYLAVDNRLKTRPVTVLREDGGFAYIADGLEAGEIVVTTRLLDALDNTLLDAHMDDAIASDAPAAGGA